MRESEVYVPVNCVQLFLFWFNIQYNHTGEVAQIHRAKGKNVYSGYTQKNLSLKVCHNIYSRGNSKVNLTALLHRPSLDIRGMFTVIEY